MPEGVMASVWDVQDLARCAARHRMHYEVDRDVIIEAEGRAAVGFEVRLFAVHDMGAQALPGCPKCIDLVAELRPILEWLVPREHRPTVVSIEPFRPALYDSKEVSGADEVALSLQLPHRDGYGQPIDACEEQCL